MNENVKCSYFPTILNSLFEMFELRSVQYDILLFNQIAINSHSGYPGWNSSMKTIVKYFYKFLYITFNCNAFIKCLKWYRVTVINTGYSTAIRPSLYINMQEAVILTPELYYNKLWQGLFDFHLPLPFWILLVILKLLPPFALTLNICIYYSQTVNLKNVSAIDKND